MVKGNGGATVIVAVPSKLWIVRVIPAFNPPVMRTRPSVKVPEPDGNAALVVNTLRVVTPVTVPAFAKAEATSLHCGSYNVCSHPA
jgi:hypothetical protein